MKRLQEDLVAGCKSMERVALVKEEEAEEAAAGAVDLGLEVVEEKDLEGAADWGLEAAADWGLEVAAVVGWD